MAEQDAAELPVVGEDDDEVVEPKVPLKTKERTAGPVEKANPFDGMTYGSAALKLLRQPELASDFDAKFKSHVEEVNTMERARLHGVHEWATGTVWGTQHVKWLAGKLREASTPEGKAELLKKVDQETINGWQDEYNQILADLATYKKMKPVGLSFQSIVNLATLATNPAMGLPAALRDEGSAAVVGALTGQALSPESWVGWPIRGATMAARVLAGAGQGIVVNAGVDPLIQMTAIESGTQDEYNWTQTLLKGGIGGLFGAGLGAIVPGGGKVGDGQVISNTELRKMISDLAREDPMWGSVGGAQGDVVTPKRLPDGFVLAQDGDTFFVRKTGDVGPDGIPTTYATGASEATAIQNFWFENKELMPGAPKNTTEVMKRVDEVTVEPVKVQKPAEPMVERPVKLVEEGEETPELIRARGGALPGEIVRTPVAASAVPSTVVKSEQQMAEELASDFNVSIRQGRLRSRTGLGQYSAETGVARVAEISDFQASAHEVAHKLDQELKLGGAPLVRRPGQPATFRAPAQPGSILARHAAELDPLDYAFNPTTGGRTFEGFAEWLRLFINNPANMRARAPGFTAEFLNLLEQKAPEYLAMLNKHVAQFEAYNKAASIDVLRASVRKPDMRTRAQQTTEAIAEQGLADTIDRRIAEIYRGAWDQFAVFARVMRAGATEAMKRTGALVVKPLAGADPELLWRAMQRSGQMAQSILRYGVPVDIRSTDRAGASLRSTLMDAHVAKSDFAPWKQEINDDFNVYLHAREEIERWRQHANGDLDVRPFGHDETEAVQAVADFEAKYPQFIHAAESWMELNRNYLRRLVQAGQLTQEQHDAIVQKNLFYAPSFRERGDIPLSGDQSWDTAAVRKFRGSSRDVLSPIEQFALMVERFERKIARDEVLRAFEDLAHAWAPGSLGRYFEPVNPTQVKGFMVNINDALDENLRTRGVPKAQRDVIINSTINLVGEDPMMGTVFKTIQAEMKGEPIVFYKGRDGTDRAARVMSEVEDPRYGMWETLTAMPEYQRHAALQVMAVASRVYSGATITDLGYAVMQYFADELAAAGFTKGYIPFISGLRGAKHVFTKDQWFKWYVEMGGVLGHHELVGGEVAARTSVEALAREGYLVEKFSIKGMMEMITSRELFTRTEAFRLHYLEMQRQGVDHWNALSGAAHHATDFFDMGRRGSRMALAQTMTPFLNPWMQGVDKARRSLLAPVWRHYFGKEVFDADAKEFQEAGRALFKFGALGFGLGFGWAAMNWGREVYRDAKPDVKGGYFVFPLGDYGVGLARKPWELSLGFTAGEYAFASLMQNDPRAGEGMLEAAWQVLQPPIPFLSNPVVKNAYELNTNKRMFDMRDFVTREPSSIVPKRLEGQRPETQVLPKTSQFAKDVGWLISVSPIKVEYGIGGFFSNLGRNALDILRSAEAVDGGEGLNLERWSITSRFIKDPNMVSDAPERYYQYMSRTTGKFPTAVASYKELLKRNDAGFAAKEFFDRLTPNEKVWTTLQTAGSTLDRTALAFDATDRRAHPFERARLALGVLSKLRTEVEWNALNNVETNNAMAKFPPDLKKRVTELLGRMILMETRNALTIMKEPGFADRPLFDMKVPFEELKLHAPDVAKELRTRYASASVYRTDLVNQVYPALRDEVLAKGSRAVLIPISTRVAGGGYEFGGQRVTVRPRRGVIQGELE